MIEGSRKKFKIQSKINNELISYVQFQKLTSKWILTQGSKGVSKFSLTHKVCYFLVKWLCSKPNKLPWSFSCFHTIKHKWNTKHNKAELKQGLLVSGAYNKQWKDFLPFDYDLKWFKHEQVLQKNEWHHICTKHKFHVHAMLQWTLNMYLNNVLSFQTFYHYQSIFLLIHPNLKQSLHVFSSQLKTSFLDKHKTNI